MAAQHLVVCQHCGRQFDANRGGYYNNQTRRYTCKSCGKKLEGDARERTTGMRQSKTAMIIKLVIAALFLVSSLTGDLELGARGVGIVLAAGLAAWALVPYFSAKKAREAEAARAAADRAAAEAARMNERKKCPACGAMTKGDHCEYCGSPLK